MTTLRLSLLASTVAAFSAGCSSFHHVPPGQSVAFAMAKKPELVALPAPEPPPVQPQRSALRQFAYVAPAPQPDLAQPALPSAEADKAEDSFALGNFCLAQGRNAEAIAAYEATVKAKPDFAEAWSRLALAYQNAGDAKKSAEALKKSRAVSIR